MSTELMDAIRRGKYTEVQRLTEESPILAGHCDEYGVSYIFLALYHRHEEIAQYLASKVLGISVHEAAALGNPLRLILVCDRSPELIHTPSADGFYPLHLAAYFARVSTLKILLGRGADIEAVANNPMQVRPIHSGVAGGSVSCVRLLLDAGASPLTCQANGITPLMGAAAAGKEDLCNLLLSRGADINALCEKGSTAADYARQRGFLPLANKLAMMGAQQ